ncbi:MAG: cell division protein FtsL [Clostridia bacterium]|nr:cell division protein FtsL [Clostridia bacterium]
MASAEMQARLAQIDNNRIKREQSIKERQEHSKQYREKVIARDKKLVLGAVVLAFIVLLLVIATSVLSAQIKYENNEIIAANEELQKDIDNLKIKIDKSKNLKTIEEYAKKNLDMDYAESSQYVYMEKDKAPDNLAQIIQEEAYN